MVHFCTSLFKGAAMISFIPHRVCFRLLELRHVNISKFSCRCRFARLVDVLTEMNSKRTRGISALHSRLVQRRRFGSSTLFSTNVQTRIECLNNFHLYNYTRHKRLSAFLRTKVSTFDASLQRKTLTALISLSLVESRPSNLSPNCLQPIPPIDSILTPNALQQCRGGRIF